MISSSWPKLASNSAAMLSARTQTFGHADSHSVEDRQMVVWSVKHTHLNAQVDRQTVCTLLEVMAKRERQTEKVER